MRLAVIISTYNQSEWLRKTLWGYARQTYGDFEVVIADDGSGHETRAVVEEAWSKYPSLELRHVWHSDDGFRKCVILNRAALAARAEYLIFTDGDCIPRRDLVATHAQLAAPGTFLSGGAVRLPREVSEAVTEADVEDARVFDAAWLAERGFEAGRHRLRLMDGTFWPTVLDALSPTGATWNGNNASTWRELVVRANGFEHAMGYGGEDREFGERLWNLGVRGRLVRHRAVAVHLDHGRPYRTDAGLRRNREIWQQTASAGIVRAGCGIDQLVPEEESFVASSPTAKGTE